MQHRYILGPLVFGLFGALLATAGCGDGEPSIGQNDDALSADDAGALAGDAASAACMDDAPPVLTPKAQLLLWPPNHKFHSIRVEDCFTVSDACQPNLKAEFIWASSDEPVDSIGDGHFAPDIQLADCGALALRAERQGPKDGRVYKLGVRVVDAAGNVAENTCSVVVDHDQRGVLGADSGESYRVLFDGKNGMPLCDGVTPPPVNPPTQQPPTQQPPANPPTQQPPVDPPAQNPPADPPADGTTPG